MIPGNRTTPFYKNSCEQSTNTHTHTERYVVQRIAGTVQAAYSLQTGPILGRADTASAGRVGNNRVTL